MKRSTVYSIILVLQLCCFGTHHVRARTVGGIAAQNRLVAITIDDLPLNGPSIGLRRLQKMTGKLLSSVRRNRVPVVGFVNESQLYVEGETDERIALLRSWLDAGAELGNHTFSHIGFKDASLSQYQDDFVRGDTIITRLLREKGQQPVFFRHPFLQMGPTEEAERSFNAFIAGRGYRIAPITVDSMDWLILSAYQKAQKRGDRRLMRQVSEEYLKFVDSRFAFAEAQAVGLFGRPISHILLLHSNELNADNFDELLDVLRNRGYRAVTLEQALADPAYRYPEKYSPTADWLLHWSLSKGRAYGPPMPPEFITKIIAEND